MKFGLIFAMGSMMAVLLVSELSSRADVLDHWTTNQITTNSFGLHHVAYGNGRYVAVGEWLDGGGIYTSEDGLNWTLRFSDMNSWGLTLNYSAFRSDGRFAGVGGWGFVHVSSNGIDWTSSVLPGDLFNVYGRRSIVYGHGLYVTVGDTNGTGNILTSPDGVTWTSRGSTPAPGGRISSVAYGSSRFVAVGDNDGLGYTSTGASAGTTWTRNSIPGGNKISYGNGLFIVPLNNKTNLISVDGINWSLKPTGLTNLLGAVTYGNGLFMAQCGISSSGSYLATSTDGTNWIQYSRPLPNFWINPLFGDYDVSLATDGARLVAVGAVYTNSGAYNGLVFTSDVLVGVRMTNNPTPKIALSGLVGRFYQIQSADILASNANNDWKTNITLQLPNSPYVWADPATPNAQRFYRGVLLP